MKRLGLITIGQSPREDVTSEMKFFLGDNIEIIECGALDNLTFNEIKRLFPRKGEHYLVTRLRNGTQISLSRERITNLVETCIKKIENNVDIIGILCTGEFSEVNSRKLIIKPSELIFKIVESILSNRKLGIMVPSRKQIQEALRKWSQISTEVKVIYASPYLDKDEIENHANHLKDCDLIILDCIGYNLKAREIVKRITGKIVLLPRILMADLIRELLDG